MDLRFEIGIPRPGDEEAALQALGEWMDPQRARALLPPACLVTFAATSVVARSADDEIAGFLVSFPSSADPAVGYVHFVWVAPQFRGHGLGRDLYAHAFDLLRHSGCRMVEAVTSPSNPGAAQFHAHLGFARDAAGTGADIEPEPGVVVFTRPL